MLRVYKKFCFAGFAGELAIELEILPFEKGTCIASAMLIFQDWISERGGAVQHEVTSGLAQIRDFLERHGDARFVACEDLNDSTYPDSGNSPIKHNRAGYTKKDSDGNTVYLIFSEVFKKEVCKGYDHQLLANAMKAQGYLLSDQGRLQKLVTIPGSSKNAGTRFFYIKADFLEDSKEQSTRFSSG